MMKRFGGFVIGGKKVLFSSICRLFAMTTVFIAMKIDFVAMKTVVITCDPGNSRQRRRSSWKSSAHLTAERREKAFSILECALGIVCKYSILRELRFITFSCFPQFG